MRFKSLLMAGTIAGLALTLSQPVSAQSATSQQIKAQQAQIDYMKRQIELMQQKLQQMQTETQATEKQVATVTKPAPDTVTASLKNGRPMLATADGNFKFYLAARSHTDYANYFGTPHGLQLNNGFNQRRAYIGVGATLYKDWDAFLEADFGNTGNENKTSGYLRTAQLTYSGLGAMGLGNLKLDFGYMEPNVDFERALGSNNLYFMERAVGENLAAGFDGNDRRLVAGARDYGDIWFGDLYFAGTRTGVGNTTSIPANGTFAPGCASVVGAASCPVTLNQARVTNEQTGMFGRAAFLPWKDDDSLIEVGLEGQYVFNTDESTLTSASSAGKTTTTTTRTLAMSFQPGLGVDSTAFINNIWNNTGAASAAGTNAGGNLPVQHAAVIGGEMAGEWRSLSAFGQYYHYFLDTVHPIAGNSASPTAEFDAFNIDVGYFLTGDSRPWDKTTGSFGTVKPIHNFDPANGGWGALEVVARFDQANLNDRSGPLLVEGGRQTLYEIGVNWYMNPNVRFMLDYIYADIRRAAIGSAGTTAFLRAPAPGSNLSPAFNAIGFRAQFTF